MGLTQHFFCLLSQKKTHTTLCLFSCPKLIQLFLFMNQPGFLLPLYSTNSFSKSLPVFTLRIFLNFISVSFGYVYFQQHNYENELSVYQTKQFHNHNNNTEVYHPNVHDNEISSRQNEQFYNTAGSMSLLNCEIYQRRRVSRIADTELILLIANLIRPPG